jgi:hypothetical protein
MTADREDQIGKELLWEYTKALTALEAFRVGFRELAGRFEQTAKILRDRPEDLVNYDFQGLRNEFETALVSVKEYNEMLAKNAERRHSLVTMKVIS